MKKFWESNRRAIKFIVLIFIGWQLAIFFISLLSQRFLPSRERFMYNDGEEIINPKVLWSWANFDGIHYLTISRNGYGLYQQAFFPLYPVTIRFLAPLFNGRDLLTGIFISNFCFLVFLYFLYKLVCLDYHDSVAKKTLIFFVVFPTSFFLGMVYTESLFLILVIGSFYAARKNRWLMAGILGGLASYTRLVGIFLFPALLYEWWSGQEVRNEKWELRNMLKVFIIPAGLLVYMKFLWQRYGDPLMFFHVQPFFGAERSSSRIILIYQVFWRYIKMIFTTKLDPLYFAVWLELLVAISFLVLLALSYKNKIRVSYLIFGLFSYIVPTLSGTFLSLPRFVLTLFPCFILLGTTKNKPLKVFLLVLFGFMFIVSASLFFRGYWVS